MACFVIWLKNKEKRKECRVRAFFPAQRRKPKKIVFFQRICYFNFFLNGGFGCLGRFPFAATT